MTINSVVWATDTDRQPRRHSKCRDKNSSICYYPHDRPAARQLDDQVLVSDNRKVTTVPLFCVLFQTYLDTLHNIFNFAKSKFGNLRHTLKITK